MLQYYLRRHIHAHIHTHKQKHAPLLACIYQYISADPAEMLSRAKAVCNLFRGAKTFHNFCSPARVPALRLFARKNWKLLPFSSASLREGGQYTHTHTDTHIISLSLSLSHFPSPSLTITQIQKHHAGIGIAPAQLCMRAQTHTSKSMQVQSGIRRWSWWSWWTPPRRGCFDRM